MSLRLSPAGFDAVRAFEGFAETSIALVGRGFVIGHGHYEDVARAAPISPEEAAELLRADLAPIVEGVANSLFAPTTQAQFDALVSFAFSIGLEAFRGSSTLRAFNAGQPLAAAEAMADWRYGAAARERSPIDALVRRRVAEQAIFLTIDPPVAAPSVVLRPAQATARTQPQAHSAGSNGLDPEVQDRLKKIFASRPETALALFPPPASEPPEPIVAPPPPPAVVSSPISAKGGADQIALGALAAFGAALLIVGAAGIAAGGPHGALTFLVFGAPGALATLIALYNLARLGS